ncbi:Helitron helicase-like protein [Phytophthora palmivora]|uniref:Helitron helicase-like protein n=1 Tax=Phytophthora palmivora TaxID=4796 RepID=A0A2P4WWM9_9STRA|nr:Helitron helicase-like protein [Phytophthora palmivora]
MDARVVSMGMTDGLDQNIIETIDLVMTTNNEYTQGYERLLESGEATPQDNLALRLREFLRNDDDLRLRLHVTRNAHPGTRNTATASEVAAIVIDRSAAEHGDVILNTRSGGFKRIFETSESYDPLQSPILFPYGERGWSYDLPYV